MPIIRQEGLLFVHIPKTGGTSVEDFFELRKGPVSHNPDILWFDDWNVDRVAAEAFMLGKEHVPKYWYHPQHYTPETLRMVVPDYDSLFKFTFVRNPYTKALSTYFFMTKIKIEEYGDFDPASFHEWLKDLLCGEEKAIREPQTSYVDGTIDFVGRHENIQADFGRMVSDLAASRPSMSKYVGRRLPWRNRRALPGGQEPLVAAMLDETRHMIEEFYAGDFSAFGYRIQ